ncbi:GPW/gp25 family protein [Sorangium sp. So ce216]
MSPYGESIDIDSPTFRRTRAPARIIAQAIEMRLSTRRGTYFDDPDYGLLLDDLLLDAAPAGRRARIAAEIAGEIEKDERVESATVTLAADAQGRMSFSADVKLDDGQTFPLTISIQDLTVDVLLRGA